MAKRRPVEPAPPPQQSDEGREQAGQPQSSEQDEAALKADRKRRRQEARRSAEAGTEGHTDAGDGEHETPQQHDEEGQAGGEKPKKRKQDKKEGRVKLEASSEAHNGFDGTSTQPEQTAADDDHFDLASLKRANKHSAPSTASSASASSSAPAVQSSSRIFVGNLPFKATDELLHAAFGPCGAIEGVHWVTDKATGKFYGSAFIDFQSPAAVPAALALDHTPLLGRPLKVGLATGRQAAGQNRFNAKQKNGAHLAAHPISDKPAGTTTVFLGNLSFDVDEAEVRALFAQCGEVKEVRWVEKDGVFKGCGFVEFYETEATDLAVKLNGREVLGRPMRVDYSGNANRDG